ncbi:hypothetical protein MTO96_028371 [Rhipicephalus appendiculatus]
MTSDNVCPNKMAANTYELRLAPDKKFPAQVARECLKDVLMTEFDDKIYDPSQVAKWTKEISQRICERLQEWLVAAFGIPTLTFVFQSSIMETACSVLLLSLPHITTSPGYCELQNKGVIIEPSFLHSLK